MWCAAGIRSMRSTVLGVTALLRNERGQKSMQLMKKSIPTPPVMPPIKVMEKLAKTYPTVTITSPIAVKPIPMIRKFS